jgi:hypothetical protein
MNLAQLKERLVPSSTTTTLSAEFVDWVLDQIDAVLLREGFTDEDRENGISIHTSPDESIAEALLSMALALRRSGSLSDEGLLLLRDALIECADDAERVRSVESKLVLDEAFRRAAGAAEEPSPPAHALTLKERWNPVIRRWEFQSPGSTLWEAAPRHGPVADPSPGMTPPTESDPNGIDAHTPGAKLDAGKNRCALVINGFSRALWQVSLVGTFGAAKYTPNGWKEVENGIERYSDAMDRHLLMEASGEEFDPDSKLLHAAHAAWNALARLELILKGRAND